MKRDELEKLTSMKEFRDSFDAYYYSFSPTGIDLIDNILMAVAAAGKGYHHTEGWNDTLSYSDQDEDTVSYIDLIQHFANLAAGVKKTK